mgnify:CR=1 FL=1
MIVPSIDLQGGRAVQLVGGREMAIDGGDPRPLAQRFGRIGEVAVVDLDAAIHGDLSQRPLVFELLELAPCRVGGGIRDYATACAFLDAGAARIVIGTAASVDLLRRLPKDRVIVALDIEHGRIMVEGWRRASKDDLLVRLTTLSPYVHGFLVTVIEREGRVAGADLDLARDLRSHCPDVALTFAGGVSSAAEIRELDAISVDAQVGMALYRGDLDLAEAFCAPLTSDRPDGLWPTIVCDEEDRALGLVYSKLESVRASIESGLGTYWSRRRGLWRKGEASGATQEVIELRLDCDRDALRFRVRQHGAGFCHLKQATCFGDERGLARLLRTLRARGDAHDDASYTAKLLADPALLESKLREEARELARASSRAEVAHEAADLFYFAGVAMQRAGVSLADVALELDRRALRITRRSGHAKPTEDDDNEVTPAKGEQGEAS